MRNKDSALLKLQITNWPDVTIDPIEDSWLELDDYPDLAEGTGVFADHRSYLVAIEYQDPRRQAPKTWQHEVWARSCASAMKLAMQEFRLIESLSSAGWLREILDVEILEDE